MRRLFLASALVAATLAVACGGRFEEAPNDCPAGSDCYSGPQDGGTSDAAKKVDGGSGGGEDCTTTTGGGIQACVPGVATAGAPTTIQVLIDDCLSGCYPSIGPCAVQVQGSVVTLTTSTTICTSGEQACPAVCQIGLTTCTLPPLAVGTYDVVLNGEPANTGGLGPRELVVEDGNGGAKGCSVPTPGTPIPPLTVDASEQKTCAQDTDCVPAQTGDACQPCACPNTAITQAARAGYEARRRATVALCSRKDEMPECAGCPPVAARCVAGTCQL